VFGCSQAMRAQISKAEGAASEQEERMKGMECELEELIEMNATAVREKEELQTRLENLGDAELQAGQVKRLEREVAALNAELAKANSIKNIKFLRKGTQNTSASYRASKAFQDLVSTTIEDKKKRRDEPVSPPSKIPSPSRVVWGSPNRGRDARGPI